MCDCTSLVYLVYQQALPGEEEQAPKSATRITQTLLMASHRDVAAALKRCRRVTRCKESG